MGTCADGRPIACWERPNGRPPEAPKCGNLLTASKHPRYLKRGNLLETSDSGDRCELITPRCPRRSCFSGRTMKDKDGSNGERWLLGLFLVLAALVILRFFR